MGKKDGHMWAVSWWSSELILNQVLNSSIASSMVEFPNIVVQLSNTATQQSMDNTVVQTEAHTPCSNI